MLSVWAVSRHVRAIALTFGQLLVLPVFGQETKSTTDTWTVEVTGGKVRGVVQDGVVSFKGIPFAAPPIGEFRWKAPQPVNPWDGVLQADKFGPSPMQPLPISQMIEVEPPSEDCLYLNVWTPANSPDERRPVMIWIYGGAFAFGGTSIPITDGRKLAEKGVVVVSIAYRIGPLGFLAHPELSAESGKGSGTYGIQDQIAGLHWVKENIAKFGGDPSRVTIFGESAGGISVGILAASPHAKNLFHRAISQSGGAMSPITEGEEKQGGLIPSLQFAEAKGKAFLAELGASDLRAARELSAEVIQNAADKLNPCWPVADGDIIVGDAYERFESGQFNDTPILVGSNSDDGIFPAPTPSPADFEKFIYENFSLAAEELIAAYPHSTGRESLRSGKDTSRDGLFAWPSWAWAKFQSTKGSGKAYLYYFDHGALGPGNTPHGADIQYVFGTLDNGLFRGQKPPGATPENVAMSDLIMSYWVNFATSGDPNGSGLPKWPAFDEKSMNTMIFGETSHVGPTPNIEKIQAFDTYYARLRKEHN